MNPIVYNSLPFAQLETPMEPSVPEYLHKTLSATGEQQPPNFFQNINTLLARQRAINTFRRSMSGKRQSNAFAAKRQSLKENNNASQGGVAVEDMGSKKTQKGKVHNAESFHGKRRNKKALNALPSIAT